MSIIRVKRADVPARKRAVAAKVSEYGAKRQPPRKVSVKHVMTSNRGVEHTY